MAVEVDEERDQSIYVGFVPTRFDDVAEVAGLGAADLFPSQVLVQDSESYTGCRLS